MFPMTKMFGLFRCSVQFNEYFTVCGPRALNFSLVLQVSGLMQSPVTITSFVLVYCSNSATRLSGYTRHQSFSAFWIRSAFTSSNTSRMAFCCSLTAEISSDKKSNDFLMSSPSSTVSTYFGPMLLGNASVSCCSNRLDYWQAWS